LSALAVVAAFTALALAGCVSDVDVVATQSRGVTKDSSSLVSNEPSAARCLPGTYRGYVFTGDASVLPIYGSSTIQFTLVESQSGEFSVLDSNATLSGTTNLGPFTAELEATNVCNANTNLDVKLTNGHMTVGKTDVPFEGVVHGTYSDRGNAFYGTWSASPSNSQLAITLEGAWFAGLGQ
jgi:hypothetical protein